MTGSELLERAIIILWESERYRQAGKGKGHEQHPFSFYSILVYCSGGGASIDTYIFNRRYSKSESERSAFQNSNYKHFFFQNHNFYFSAYFARKKKTFLKRVKNEEIGEVLKLEMPIFWHIQNLRNQKCWVM